MFISFLSSFHIKLRQGIWEKAHEKILEHNKRAARGLETFKMKHNKFSDLVRFFF